MPKRSADVEIDATIARLKDAIAEAQAKIDALMREKAGQHPLEGSVISRERVERVWDVMKSDQAQAETVLELASKVGMSRPVVQRILYILLTEGRAERQPKKMEGKGKIVWEYWRHDYPSQEPIKPAQKPFDMNALIRAMPREKSQAIDVRGLAMKMRIPPITIRLKVNGLVSSGRARATMGKNYRNQQVTKYYLVD